MRPTWEVRRIRESLGLNQEQAASLFGGGRNAFSKYENGAVTQAASMDRLLRVAERHPHIVRDLEEIVGANGTPLKGVFEAYKTAALMSVKLKPMPAANMSSVHGKMASGSSEQWV